jgi:hypothetical protein
MTSDDLKTLKELIRAETGPLRKLAETARAETGELQDRMTSVETCQRAVVTAVREMMGER